MEGGAAHKFHDGEVQPLVPLILCPVAEVVVLHRGTLHHFVLCHIQQFNGTHAMQIMDCMYDSGGIMHSTQVRESRMRLIQSDRCSQTYRSDGGLSTATSQPASLHSPA